MFMLMEHWKENQMTIISFFSKNNIQKFKALDIMGFFLIKTMRRKPCIDRQRDRQKDERTDRHTRVSQYTLFTFGAEVKKIVYFFSLQLWFEDNCYVRKSEMAGKPPNLIFQIKEEWLNNTYKHHVELKLKKITRVTHDWIQKFLI